MDGVEAEKVIVAYSKEFRVEVDELWEQWDSYFSTKGITLQSAALVFFLWLVVDVACAVCMPRLALWIMVPLDVLIAYLVARVVIQRRLQHQPTKQLTVADLVRAEEKGRLRLK